LLVVDEVPGIDLEVHGARDHEDHSEHDEEATHRATLP
jgi:hypothetical protein